MNIWLPLLWLIPALPLLGAVMLWTQQLIAPRPGDAAEGFTRRIALAVSGLSLLGAAATLLLRLLGQLPASQIELGQWLVIGETPLLVSLTLDSLTLALASLFALLGTLTLRFSLPYMHREPGFHRYFAALLLFLGAMQLIALAGSAWLAFVGWELAGIASFLLIGFARERANASAAALYALVCNRIGDAGFLLGIGFALWWTGTLEWPTLAQRLNTEESVSASLITGGFLLAALVKSGQVPFTPWITRALEGPTPSSAIFYGSLLLHAGVALVLRLEPLFRHTPEVMLLMALVGALTALYAWLVGLAQTDIKSSLLYAALAQVGLMFLACGLGWFTLAAWHLGVHATWRLWQFLIAPSWLLLADRPAPQLADRQVPRLSGPLARLLDRAAWHTAARNGLWLALPGELLLTRPTQRLARDMATIDARMIEPALGLPRAASNEGDATPPHPGAVGKLTNQLAKQLARFEAMLVLQKNGGNAALAIKKIGVLFARIESLLEQPRYLFLFIMATLVVIL